jgi:AGZA family xanthine/uracil permease-like MFS transporter
MGRILIRGAAGDDIVGTQAFQTTPMKHVPATILGLVLAAIGVFVIERKWEMAAAFAGAGAVMSFFGFMHGPAVGFAVTPSIALAYAVVAGFLFACGRLGWAGEEGVAEPVMPDVQPAE